MGRLVGLLYLLSAILTLFLLAPGCASLHDPTWDIGPTKPENKRADLLTPKEIEELELTHPEYFVPAINENQNTSSKPVAPERVLPIYRHQNNEKELIQLPIIILDLDLEIPVPDGPST